MTVYPPGKYGGEMLAEDEKKTSGICLEAGTMKKSGENYRSWQRH